MVKQNEEQKINVGKMEMVYILIYLLGFFFCKPYMNALFLMIGSLLFMLVYIGIPKRDLSREKKEFYKWVLFSINQIVICYIYLLHICYVKFVNSIFVIFSIVLTVSLIISIIICCKLVTRLKHLHNTDNIDVGTYKEKQKIKRERAGICAVPAALIGMGISRYLIKGSSQEVIVNIYFGLLIILLFIMIISAFYLIYDHFYKYLLGKN